MSVRVTYIYLILFKLKYRYTKAGRYIKRHVGKTLATLATLKSCLFLDIIYKYLTHNIMFWWARVARTQTVWILCQTAWVQTRLVEGQLIVLARFQVDAQTFQPSCRFAKLQSV